jgi:hypothetical protein
MCNYMCLVVGIGQIESLSVGGLGPGRSCVCSPSPPLPGAAGGWVVILFFLCASLVPEAKKIANTCE